LTDRKNAAGKSKEAVCKDGFFFFAWHLDIALKGRNASALRAVSSARHKGAAAEQRLAVDKVDAARKADFQARLNLYEQAAQ
jgi:hypothetical protein